MKAATEEAEAKLAEEAEEAAASKEEALETKKAQREEELDERTQEQASAAVPCSCDFPLARISVCRVSFAPFVAPRKAL